MVNANATELKCRPIISTKLITLQPPLSHQAQTVSSLLLTVSQLTHVNRLGYLIKC